MTSSESYPAGRTIRCKDDEIPYLGSAEPIAV